MNDFELLARESEREIRKQNMNAMLSESHEKKVSRSKNLVTEFVDILGLDTVYVSTSGGKDSACLSKLCKKKYPNIKHIMFDTGLEYQATKDLAKKQGATIVPPQTSWVKFCEEQGYPVGSKQVSKRIHDAYVSPLGCAITMFSKVYHLSHKWLHFLDGEIVDFPISNKCCDEFKKKPAHRLKMNPIIGTRIQESSARKNAWKKSGCNSYSDGCKSGISRPISLWKDEDIEQYVEEEKVELSELYTQYQEKRTGCVNCPYGAQMDGSRFDLLKKLEPKRYEYFMSTKLKKILALSGVEIVTDKAYQAYMTETQKDVEKWHEKHKGEDNYLTFKIRWMLERYKKEDIEKAIEHLSKNLFYPKETIFEALRKEAE